jgi:HSP20 family protein
MNHLIPSNSKFVSRFLNDPFDLLFKDFFDSSSGFYSLFEIEKIGYPVDLKESSKGLEFDIAVIGLDKKDIKIEIQDGNILSIIYEKAKEIPKINESETYLYKGITNKSFNMSWRISPKFDLSKLDAKLEKGLLKILVPISPEKESKAIEIKD